MSKRPISGAQQVDELTPQIHYQLYLNLEM